MATGGGQSPLFFCFYIPCFPLPPLPFSHPSPSLSRAGSEKEEGAGPASGGRGTRRLGRTARRVSLPKYFQRGSSGPPTEIPGPCQIIKSLFGSKKGARGPALGEGKEFNEKRPRGAGCFKTVRACTAPARAEPFCPLYPAGAKKKEEVALKRKDAPPGRTARRMSLPKYFQRGSSGPPTEIPGPSFQGKLIPP